MKKPVITGLGVVSPVGTGMVEVWNAMERGAAGMRKVTRFPFPLDISCGEITDFDLGNYVQDRRFRRTEPISQYALASTVLAMRDAGLPEAGEDTVLFVGITHGALSYTQEFHKELTESGPEAVSPIHFSESVLNAPAGNTSICFGLRGPVHTVVGCSEAGLKALMMACRMLDEGEAERAIVSSAEELNEISLYYYTRMGLSMISEGAGTIVIEREAHTNSSAPYCYISGMGSECNPLDPESALHNALESSINRAGLKKHDIDLVLTDQNTRVGRFLKGVPTASSTRLMGNAFAVSPIWDIALSAMAIKSGALTGAILNERAGLPDGFNNLLVCGADRIGGAVSVILSKRE